jgi:hypothetical protein
MERLLTAAPPNDKETPSAILLLSPDKAEGGTVMKQWFSKNLGDGRG